MTALWVGSVVLAALTGLCFVRVWVQLIYDETQPDALYCSLSVLGLRFKLAPGKSKKAEKKRRSDTPLSRKQSNTPLSALFGYASVVLEALPELLGKLVIQTFTLRCFFGGSESDYPLKYGEAWAVLGTAIPILEELLDIRERDYSVAYDPSVQGLRLYFNGNFSLRLGKLIVILVRYLVKFTKVEKGGMKHE